MRYNELGRTGIKVSELCLGSMTWGTQNTLDEGHAQIDASLDHGINFVDTAEMYPTNPVRAENVGRTEEIIGEWFAKTGRRNDVILATKITGKGQKMVRDDVGINADTIREAIENSLRRLKTDVIDLYQLTGQIGGRITFARTGVLMRRGRTAKRQTQTCWMSCRKYKSR